MTDKEITALYLARSERAVMESKAHYGALIRYLAGRILTDPQDIEECENDTYLSAWQSIPPHQPDNLKAYLARIARNLACKRLEYLGAAKRKPEVLLSLEELAGTLADGTPSGASDDALRELLHSFLAKEKPEVRRVFLLRYWMGCSIAEISGQTGFSHSKIETILHRARNRLRDTLRRKGYRYDK